MQGNQIDQSQTVGTVDNYYVEKLSHFFFCYAPEQISTTCCCCNCSIKTGCQIRCVVSIIIGIASVVFRVISNTKINSQAIPALDGILITIAAIVLIADIIMLIATYTYSCLLAYIAYMTEVIMYFINIVFIIISIIILAPVLANKDIIAQVISLVISVFLDVWFIWIFYRFAIMLAMGEWQAMEDSKFKPTLSLLAGVNIGGDGNNVNNVNNNGYNYNNNININNNGNKINNVKNMNAKKKNHIMISNDNDKGNSAIEFQNNVNEK